MGQDISLKSERKAHDLNHDLTFSAHTINCVCHSIGLMSRVLGTGCINLAEAKVSLCNFG